MSLTGRVEDLSVAELLYMVGISRRSGLLLVEPDRSSPLRILFSDGNIVAVQSRSTAKDLIEFLSRQGLADRTHLAVLEREAREADISLEEQLLAEGKLQPGQLESELKAVIEAFVRASLDISEGSFDFQLVPDFEAMIESFGSLALKTGIAPGRLPEVAERSKRMGLKSLSDQLSLPEEMKAHATPRSPIEFHTSEGEFSLPSVPTSVAGRHRDSGASEHTDGTPTNDIETDGTRVILAVDRRSGFEREIHGRLQAAGMAVFTVGNMEGALRELRAGLAAEDRIAIIADVAHGGLPGMELLARAKLLDRRMGVIVLIHAGTSPSQGTAYRERAGRLGATHVVHVPDDSVAEATGAELAELVTGLLLGGEGSEEHLPPGVQALSEAGSSDLSGISGPLPDAPAALPASTELSELARTFLPSQEAADIGASLLDVAARFVPRAILLVRLGERIRGFGSFAPLGEGERLTRAVQVLDLDVNADDILARVFREGHVQRGGAQDGPRNLTLHEALRPDGVRELAVLPIGTVAALYVDDAGTTPLPDLGTLMRFFSAASTALGGALAASITRAEARRLRGA